MFKPLAKCLAASASHGNTVVLLSKLFEDVESFLFVLRTAPKQTPVDHDRHPEAGWIFVDCPLVVNTSLLSSWHIYPPNSISVLYMLALEHWLELAAGAWRSHWQAPG